MTENMLSSSRIKTNKALFETENHMPYIHRDISWLSFNYRVLQEAMDTSVPLFERIKFLAIYSSNLDEFFRVRMANQRNLLRVGKKTKRELETPPKMVVREIQQIVNRQQQEFSRILEKQIVPALRKHGIFLIRRLELNEEQQAFVEMYFRQHMLPYVQPVLLVKNKIRPFLINRALYLSALLRSSDDPHGPEEYAIVNIPSDHLPRFVQLPSRGNRHDVIFLDDIVRHSLSWMFPGYDILDTFSIKLTRDAELYIDDEYSGDLIQKIKDSLAKRHVGPASRFVYDRDMPASMLALLQEVFSLDKYDILQEGRYHNNFDFFRFPDFGMHQLKYNTLEPLPHPSLSDSNDLFRTIRNRDQLIHTPYQSYDSVVRFFEEAAKDPKVTHIKITQYRVARKSRILEALINAVKAGKQVSVFIEVKARFDEEANIKWGERLEKAGVSVHYSFPGVKVHAKLGLIRRMESKGPRLYTYLSTGNYHEETARVYSDYGLFTADERLSTDVARVFSYLETGKEPVQPFEHLAVGQFNLRSQLMELIDFEKSQAQAGNKGHIILKMNSLQDREMIEKLYEASNAGVEISLIVRGICCLAPGMAGYSERIKAISIVDRYLEHGRIFYFHHGGEERIYMSSADWMVRNLSFRVETTFPVFDAHIKAEIKDYLNIQLSDNVKARNLDASMSNAYQRLNGDIPIRSQMETYYYLKRKIDQLPDEPREE
jgi:polyphosphate kinase